MRNNDGSFDVLTILIWIMVLGILFSLLFRSKDFDKSIRDAQSNCNSLGGHLVMTTCVKKESIIDNRPYSE